MKAKHTSKGNQFLNRVGSRKPWKTSSIHLKLHQLNFEGARTGSAMIGYKLAKLKFSTTHYHTTC